jgi:hypothetical protein
MCSAESFQFRSDPPYFKNQCGVILRRQKRYGGERVSLRTVDMMLADGDITPMRLRGKLVRFYLPDVLQELREKAKTSKRNVARRV